MTESAPALLIQSDFFDTPLRMVSGSVDRPIYSNLLDAIADKIKVKIKNDGQFVLVIRGGTGSGKSNLALQLIRLLDPSFNLDFKKGLEGCYIYSPKDLANKLLSGSSQRINWYDEGSVIFNSLNVMSKGGRLMGSFFDTIRLDHFISIICLPSDKEIDGRVLKHMDMLIECPKVSPLPKWADFSARGFFDAYERIIYKSGKFYDKLIGTGYCRAVPKKLKNEYEEIKRKHADEFKKYFAKKVLE